MMKFNKDIFKSIYLIFLNIFSILKQGNRDSLCISAQYDIYDQVMHMFYKYIAKTAPAKGTQIEDFYS